MTSHAIIEYLKTHDLISINRMERRLGIPQSTIGKALKENRDIPDKWIERIVKGLKGYGIQKSKQIYTEKDIIDLVEFIGEKECYGYLEYIDEWKKSKNKLK